MSWLPDEARVLQPPGLINRNSLGFGLIGYLTGLTHNAISHRPVLRTGVHRQLLMTTLGVFIGYHITKYENYKNAKLDRELFEYIRRNPDDFKKSEKKTFAEVLEEFYPIR
ncbi:NADH dehydrogenase [ubiquinone] 1 subunit C2 [Ascaphus truei]|uniref:NADH dehydrogenase [ubiquinone] 1 subunit C2 n=1 Tax=Ascaphus truei TaxID=8439 RepID=UPI003F5AD9CB